MSEAVIINENSDPEIPGDVGVFSTADAAALYLEPWFADEPHLILSVSGRRFRMVSDDDVHVRLELLEDAPVRPEVARRFLLSHFCGMNLDNAVNADRFRLSDGELAGMDNQTLAELILSYEAKSLWRRFCEYIKQISSA